MFHIKDTTLGQDVILINDNGEVGILCQPVSGVPLTISGHPFVNGSNQVGSQAGPSSISNGSQQVTIPALGTAQIAIPTGLPSTTIPVVAGLDDTTYISSISGGNIYLTTTSTTQITLTITVW